MNRFHDRGAHTLVALLLCWWPRIGHCIEGLVILPPNAPLPQDAYIFVVQGSDGQLTMAVSPKIPDTAAQLGVRYLANSHDALGTGHAEILRHLIDPTGDIESFLRKVPEAGQGQHVGGGIIYDGMYLRWNPMCSAKAAGETAHRKVSAIFPGKESMITMNGLLPDRARPWGALIPESRLPSFFDALVQHTGKPLMLDRPISDFENSEFYIFSATKHQPDGVRMNLMQTYPNLEDIMHRVNADHFPMLRQAQGMYTPDPPPQWILRNPNLKPSDTLGPGDIAIVADPGQWGAPPSAYHGGWRQAEESIRGGVELTQQVHKAECAGKSGWNAWKWLRWIR